MNEVVVKTVCKKVTVYQCRNASDEKLREELQVENGTLNDWVCTYTLADRVNIIEF